MKNWIILILVILVISIILFPQYESFQPNEPVGPSVQYDRWTTSSIAPHLSGPINPNTSIPETIGQSGPCVSSGKFANQIGIAESKGCPIEKSNLSPTIPEKISNTVLSGLDFNNLTKMFGLKQQEKTGKSDFKATTGCYATQFPPAPDLDDWSPESVRGPLVDQPIKQFGGNMDLWCRMKSGSRLYGNKRSQECGFVPAQHAECSQLYFDKIGKFDQTSVTQITKCLPWNSPDETFQSQCQDSKFFKKIVGQCQPGEGRGLCGKFPSP